MPVSQPDQRAFGRQSLDLGANRIGHAVYAVQDPSLMDLMVEGGIGIEANLTSNVQTSTVKDYASHPLRRFLELWIVRYDKYGRSQD